MSSITISAVRPRTSILDRSLSKGKGEVSLSCFALLFSELVQYCQNRVYTVPELQNKLAEIGAEIGHRVTDLLVVREKAGIVEAVLCDCGFPAKVTAHWHKGTTYMVKFDDAVIARDKQLEER
ncbi:trafficking protein particle complex subunit 5 isoform X3 [Vespula pensylvanica]|uniref:trafficking protein particle complex subunit 5 isoform X3 n=1 Tax=Vespula pensylvanica TaxID=30213 RepID=UPI001CB9DF02|nr:trafficking protein particle complex subunit 5 isoform X3 [Vespula pensylvanica]XP_050850526.1 trafficking protein particle complex subunit 5 isoform X3 [Vespula vulgaris]